tara:strand:+ start:124 stop:858 length:735 start_codon:yes stop_codon:yes gene_type:complete
MIKSLIRANSNNKGIFIVITYDKDLKPILLKKSSSSKESIKNLKNEVRGVEWYSGVSRKSFIKKTTNLEDYFSIDYEYVTGKKANFRKGYLHNLSYIEKAIKIYCELWSGLINEKTIIHGDFSLDNIIFNNEKSLVIDWEHFTDSEKIPLGFDALNLIYEQLFFVKQTKRLNKKIVNHAKSMLQYLAETKCLDEIYWRHPLSAMHELIINNKFIWKKQLNKLPIMMFEKDEVDRIDKYICMKKE